MPILKRDIESKLSWETKEHGNYGEGLPEEDREQH